MKDNQEYRDFVADLFLTDPETGGDLVLTGPIEKIEDEQRCFEVGEDKPDGNRWKVTFSIEEV